MFKVITNYLKPASNGFQMLIKTDLFLTQIAVTTVLYAPLEGSLLIQLLTFRLKILSLIIYNNSLTYLKLAVSRDFVSFYMIACILSPTLPLWDDLKN